MRLEAYIFVYTPSTKLQEVDMMEYDLLYKVMMGVLLVVSGILLGFLLGTNYMFFKLIQIIQGA